MQLITFDALHPSPWKNGGGITREIAALRQADAVLWRLSIADVDVDGPFSRFAGLQRILTVIKGHGMELVSPTETLQADLGVPVHFDGEVPIQSRLKHGPIRDFNVIYDPLHYAADVRLFNGPIRHVGECKAGELMVVHCIEGELLLDPEIQLQSSDTVVLDEGPLQMLIGARASALIVTLQAVAKS